MSKFVDLALVALSVAILGFFVGRCSASDPAPLPPKVAAAVERHVIESVVDTATTHRLERDTAAAGRRARAAADSEHQAQASAATEKARADSLEHVAALATSARDSAIAYHAALEASVARGNSLDGALALAGRQLFAAAQRQVETDSVATIWKTHAIRGDSVIAQLLPVAEERDKCRILWLRCPTRTQVFVGGVLAGAGGYAIATGKIKIPIGVLKF